MVFSDSDKAIILHYHQKKYTPYKIWKENPEKNWNKGSIYRLIERFEETGSMAHKEGSGHPRTATCPENEEKVEEMICSQDEPGTHVSPSGIAKELEVSESSVRRMVKRKGYKNYKRMKTPSMNDGTRKRRVERSTSLFEKFRKNPRMIERAVFQDESDFPLQIPNNPQNNRVYSKSEKKDIPHENLFHPCNRQSVKVMVSAGLTWHGVTRPIFVGKQGVKVNAINYKKHLEKQLFPAIERIYPRNDWIFLQDGASSHTSNLVQEFLNETIPRRFIKKDQWPPNSPDTNPLDYYFWNQVKTNVYKNNEQAI